MTLAPMKTGSGFWQTFSPDISGASGLMNSAGVLRSRVSQIPDCGRG